MALRLKREEPVSDGVRRIARQQTEKALAATTGGPSDERVHDARVRCKKLRSLLRLAQPALGEVYRRENAFLRDAAQGLSARRDASVAGTTFEQLTRRNKLDADAANAVRTILAGVPDGDGEEERLAAFAGLMRAFHQRIGEWPLPSDGFATLADGLTATYRRGRKAMQAALDSNDDASRHEWRKQAKYHGYHIRLLRNVWKPAMKARARELQRLSDLLGRDHDLAVLRGIIGAATLDPKHAEAVTTLIDRRREKLLARARSLGERLYAEKPKMFAKQIRRHWKVWRA